jgi:hypothetical protein
LISVQPAAAHHFGAGFNSGTVVELKGTIKEFQFKNPHTWIQVLVPDANGKVTEWSLEWGSPNSLGRQGYRPSSFPPGAKITVRLNPMRNGSPAGGFIAAKLRMESHRSRDDKVSPSAGNGLKVNMGARITRRSFVTASAGAMISFLQVVPRPVPASSSTTPGSHEHLFLVDLRNAVNRKIGGDLRAVYPQNNNTPAQIPQRSTCCAKANWNSSLVGCNATQRKT